MAAKEEWFRNTKWDASIAEVFFAKLERARSQRDQYLAIQATALVRSHPKTALDLTDMFLQERRSNSSLELLRALEARAEAL